MSGDGRKSTITELLLKSISLESNVYISRATVIVAFLPPNNGIISKQKTEIDALKLSKDLISYGPLGNG